MNGKTIILALGLLLGFEGASVAATLYVDTTGIDNSFSDEALNCSTPSDTDYDPVTRQCGSGSFTVFSSIQAAIAACSVGDDIQIRNGTIATSDVDIPESKNGTAWTSGNYTTLRSYPGEWAILDGSGNNTTPVIRHVTTTNKDQTADTKYWKFERLEITGARFGILLQSGPVWVRYCFFNQCQGPFDGDEPMAALWINEPQECIIEYNYFFDAYDADGTSTNDSLLGFLADYHEESVDGAEGEAYDPSRSIRANIIRYNFFDGNGNGHSGIHYKGDQRFGNNSRNPSTVRNEFPDNGDEIHHNILVNIGGIYPVAILAAQDNIWVHHNILEGQIAPGGWQHVPITYNQVVNNNTLRGAHASINVSGGVVPGSNNVQSNCYDTGEACDPGNGYHHTVTPHAWLYNNIVANNTGSFSYDEPVTVAHFMVDDWGDISGDSYTHDFSKMIIENNLFHDCADDVFLMGSCDNETGPATCGDGELNNSTQTLSEFNNHSATWRGVGSVVNWDVDTPNLFLSEIPSETDYWIPTGSYVVDDQNSTVADAGIGAQHPYRSGVAQFPSYLGAVDPSDSDWVGGVMNDLASTSWLKSMSLERDANDDPTWTTLSEEAPGAQTVGDDNGGSSGGCFVLCPLGAE